MECQTLLKTGPRKGQLCGNKAKYENYCSRHRITGENNEPSKSKINKKNKSKKEDFEIQEITELSISQGFIILKMEYEIKYQNKIPFKIEYLKEGDKTGFYIINTDNFNPGYEALCYLMYMYKTNRDIETSEFTKIIYPYNNFSFLLEKIYQMEEMEWLMCMANLKSMY